MRCGLYFSSMVSFIHKILSISFIYKRHQDGGREMKDCTFMVSLLGKEKYNTREKRTRGVREI